jgi:hypothetical protein
LFKAPGPQRGHQLIRKAVPEFLFRSLVSLQPWDYIKNEFLSLFISISMLKDFCFLLNYTYRIGEQLGVDFREEEREKEGE